MIQAMSTTFWIQLLGIIFGLAMMYFSFVRFKRKEINNIELLVWFAGWIILVSVAVIPSILDPVIEPLNFHRRLDFFVVIGFFALLALGFYNYTTVKKMERKLGKFVRRAAMQEASGKVDEIGKTRNETKDDEKAEDNKTEDNETENDEAKDYWTDRAYGREAHNQSEDKEK